MVEDAVTSDSVGDPSRFRTLEELEHGLRALPSASTRSGRVALIVARRDGGRRDTLQRVRLTPGAGVPGDAWSRRVEPDGDAQITVMQMDVAQLLANGQPLTLFGDNLFVDLDLSVANLPTGSRLRLGTAVVVVTPKPHDGCRKFRARFGGDALRLVSMPALRSRNLRGIYMRAVEPGEVAAGDAVEIVSTAPR
ncbi:MAG: MOSC domain-containing protein [Candidatus Binatia bacterium]